MAAGVFVMAGLPALVGGALLGWGANTIKGRGAKPAEKLEHAIQNLETIKARLKPTRYFRSEIDEIKIYIKVLEKVKYWN